MVIWHPVKWMTIDQGRNLPVWNIEIKPSCRKAIISRGACSRGLRILPCGQEGTWKSQKYWIVNRKRSLNVISGKPKGDEFVQRRPNQQY